MEKLKVQTAHKSTILHLVISLNIGGLERFVIDLISTNLNLFNQVLVCLESDGELSGICKAEVLSLNMQPGLHLGVAWKIAKIVRDKHVDLIHTHNEKAQLYGGIAGFLAKVPVVHTKHGLNKTDRISTLRNNFSAHLCRKVVAVSLDASAQCIVEEKIPASKVRTILNGIDIEKFARSGPSNLFKMKMNFSPLVPVVGIVARLSTIKDHATLLSACGLLVDSGQKFLLLVVGDGPLRTELKNVVVSLGIADYVKFTGARSDIPEIMQTMDIFVLSSISEGISLTVIEAMSCELPVVATNVGGNPEVVIDGETGYLVPAQDAQALADKIARLLGDAQLRERFGKSGRERAVAVFSLSRAASEYAALYRTVLGSTS